MINKLNAEFIISAEKLSQCPDFSLPEFPLLGRSNVGKSSFINALANNKKLAKTSNTPGKTRLINFFNFADTFTIADLPGYGYAKVAESEKKKWGQMIENYLHNSKQLRAVFLLIDIRHAPSANDKMMYDWIVYQGYEPIIIATKMDKLKRSQISKHVKLVREGLGLKKESIVIPFSATSKQGREEIWNLMDSILESEVSENEDE